VLHLNSLSKKRMGGGASIKKRGRCILGAIGFHEGGLGLIDGTEEGEERWRSQKIQKTPLQIESERRSSVTCYARIGEERG